MFLPTNPQPPDTKWVFIIYDLEFGKDNEADNTVCGTAKSVQVNVSAAQLLRTVFKPVGQHTTQDLF
jgi:hypothetical protein